MKHFTPFFQGLCLAAFFLLISCDNTPPTENIETPIASSTKEETPVVAEKMPATLSLDSLATDTTSLDTIKAVQKVARPTREPAKIKFKETTYTYDTIKQGEVIEYNFKFQNVGERPLSIKDVKGSCGCTIGSYPFLDIAPNEKNTIKARFDSKGKKGVQFTTITVYSNANPKGDVLSLKGFVVEE
jgi:hypothetical protein